MDGLCGAILTGGAVIITAIVANAVTRPEPVHQACVNQCRLVYSGVNSQYTQPDKYRDRYIECFQRCFDAQKQHVEN